MRTTTRAGRTAGLLTAGLLLFPVAGCSEDTVGDDAADAVSSAGADASAALETAVEDSPVDLDCSGTSCSLTLDAGQEAELLGTRLAFTSSADGTATVRVGEQEATCRQGETVEAGPLSLECTDVTDEQVSLTATLG